MEGLNYIEGRGWEGLPSMSKVMYEDTYFLPNETYNEWVERIATAYANDEAHNKRLQIYLKNYWMHPSTPPSANAGTDRGLPISCYVGDVPDDKEGIFNTWTEAGWLGSQAGGIGRSWSSVRELNSPVGTDGGTSSGVIPFMCVDDALTRAVSQGNLRRMSQANYLLDSHPEIEEFVEIRKATGDQNRRAHSLHHGVVITDKFMNSVINDKDWELVSPKTNTVIKTIKAKTLWTKILEMRVTTGEPYILFYDNANRLKPKEYKTLGLDIHTSNLCNEIYLNTSAEKTNVCCLASINLEYWDEYKGMLDLFIADCTDFLDNILQSFIDKTENKVGFEKARRAAMEERALGLGVMGFHSLLQKKMIPFESALATGINKNIFDRIRTSTDKHQASIEKICPMSELAGTHRRNIVTLAVAPTMSISNLCNLSSSGIEPWMSNAFSKKLKQGTFPIRNKFLDKYVKDYCYDIAFAGSQNLYGPQDWIDEQWKSIVKNAGSVQHLEWMDDYIKDVFKTAYELDQRWVINHAGDRVESIDQGQSVNLFIAGNSHVQYVSDLHMLAWKRGLKGLYYLRSTNPNKASTENKERQKINTNNFDECLSCT